MNDTETLRLSHNSEKKLSSGRAKSLNCTANHMPGMSSLGARIGKELLDSEPETEFKNWKQEPLS